MSIMKQWNKNSLRVVWSRTRTATTIVNGDMEFISRDDNHGRFFVVAGLEGAGSTYKIQFFNIDGNNDWFFTSVVNTAAANLEYRGVSSNGKNLIIATRDTSSNRDQIRHYDLNTGNQISNNGMGNRNFKGCTWDGRRLWTISNGGTRIDENILTDNGTRWRRVGITNISQTLNSLTYDGRFFYGIDTSGNMHQYTEAFNQIRKTAFVGAGAINGVMTDGKDLYTWEPH